VVFCRLIETMGSILIYSVGSDTDDMTGKLKINVDTGEFEVTERPKVHDVWERHIRSMLGKYLGDMKRGNIPKAMSRQI